MTSLAKLAGVAALALLTFPAAAAASVTIGSTDPATAVEEPPLSTTRTVLQTAAPDGGPKYVVPDGNWVVISVAARLAGGPSAGSAAVRFARAQNGSYLWVGRTPLDVTDNSGEKVFSAGAPSQQKVQGGDLLGLTFGHGVSAYSNTTVGYTYSKAETDPADGSEEGLTAAPDPGAYAISATLEPDADQDGYGDETQDACTRDPARHEAPCATDIKVTQTFSSTYVVGGQDFTGYYTVQNLGSEKAINVRFTNTYGQTMGPHVWPAFCQNTPAASFCSLGDIAPGGFLTFNGTIGTIVVGTNVTEAQSPSVDMDNADTDKSNNSARAQIITITPASTTPTPTPIPTATCVAPKLKGKTLAAAKKAVKAARCALGKITKPKRKLRKGYRLVVSTQSRKAGSKFPAATKINLTLKAVKKRR